MPLRHQHHPEKYYLTVPFAEFPKRFGTHSHTSPRHMTVLPWFRLHRNNDIVPLMQELGNFCHAQEPFTVTFGDSKGYGPDGKEPGQPVVAGKDSVIALHCGLLAVVRRWADVIDESWCGESFDDPHSSLVDREPFGCDPVGVWSVLVIGKFVKDEHRVNDPDKEYSGGFRMRGRIN